MPEATDDTHARAPWWLEVPLMVVVLLVATVAGAGLVLGLAGRYHTALAYAIGVPIAVGLILWARPWRDRVGAPRGVALPAIGAIAISVAFFAVAGHQPAQHVTIDRDPGSYTSTGVMLSNTGALEADPPPAALRELPNAQTASAAVYDVGGGRLNFQFNHLTSVIAAVALDTIGVRAMFRVGALFGAIALLSIYCVAVRATRRPFVALLAPALFAVIAPLLYISRDTFSESSTLLFLWTGLLVLCRLSERPSVATGAIVGVLVGATAMARVDALLYLAMLFGGLALLVASATTPSEKLARLRSSLAAIGAAIAVAIIGFVDLDTRSWLYLQAFWSDYKTGILLCAAALVAGLVLLVFFRRPERREVARRWGRRVALPAGVLVGLLFAGFWFVRPHLHATHWSMNIGLIGRLQSEEGKAVDPTRNYAEHSFLWMVWFLGVPSIIAAIGGAIVLTVDALRARANAAMLGVLVLLLGTGPLYWWRPSIVPDMLWATRRYIPAVYPALVVAGVVAVAWLIGRIDQRAIRAVIGGACAAAMVVPALATTVPIWRQHEQFGFSTTVTDACGALDDNAAVVVVGTPDWVFLPQTIRAWCDVPVVSIGDPKALTAARLDRLSHDLAAEGYRLYVVGMNPKNLTAAGADLTNAVTTSLALNTNSAEQTLTHTPDSYLNQRLQLTVVPVG